MERDKTRTQLVRDIHIKNIRWALQRRFQNPVKIIEEVYNNIKKTSTNIIQKIFIILMILRRYLTSDLNPPTVTTQKYRLDDNKVLIANIILGIIHII